MISITGTYHFCAAHFLPRVPAGHRCRNLHGHNYKLEITVGDIHRDIVEPRDPDGMLIDFYDLDKIMKPILAEVDHNGALNDIEGLENPTAEVIAGWFLHRLEEAFKGYQKVIVHAVRVYETPECYATVSRV